MKRNAVILLLLLLIATVATACSKKDTKDEVKEINIKLSDLADKLAKVAGELPKMEHLSSDDSNAQDTFSTLCDLEYDFIDSYYISYASEAAADEIFIIKVKNEKDMDTVKSALKDRKEARRAAFNAYMPTEVTKVEESEITSNGRYIAFLICPTSGRTVNAFQDCFKE